MNDTDVFHTPRRLSHGQRWLAGWRQVAQLGMLLDGCAHIRASGFAEDALAPRKHPANGDATGAPRLARLRA